MAAVPAIRDRWYLEEMFPGLLSWNRWWWRVRRAGELLCLGSTAFEPEWPSPQDIPRINQHFGATCEIADDHPIFADIPYDPSVGLLLAHDVALNSEYAMDCAVLADIADVLGRDAERDELRDRGRAVADTTERLLWNEETASYRSRRTDTGDFTMKEWSEARHVHENCSMHTGDGCDKANGEPFHSWGALLSLIPLIESGAAEYFKEPEA